MGFFNGGEKVWIFKIQCFDEAIQESVFCIQNQVPTFPKMNRPNPHSLGNIIGIISPFSGQMWVLLSKTRELHQGPFSQGWQQWENLALHWETRHNLWDLGATFGHRDSWCWFSKSTFHFLLHQKAAETPLGGTIAYILKLQAVKPSHISNPAVKRRAEHSLRSSRRPLPMISKMVQVQKVQSK